MMLIWIAITSCSTDDPKFAPIDTSQVEITASINTLPKWLTVSDELTVTVSDINMTAPKGVVLKSISLVANDGMASWTVDDKPFSGKALEFKVPLAAMQGRTNFSVRGHLVRKDYRDAETIIADNLQTIVFSREPEFKANGFLFVSVKSTSTSGEEYSNMFEVRSGDDNLLLQVPQDKLYWQPESGTASTLQVTLGSGATAWSNTSFGCEILSTAIGHRSGDEPTLKLTIANTPGSLTAQKLQMYVVASYFGTWENVTISPYNLTSVYGIIETE